MAVQNYGLIDTAEELDYFINKLIDEGKTVGYDIESGYLGADTVKGSLRSETSLLAGISFTNDVTWARYVTVGHDLADNVDNTVAARLFWKLFHALDTVAHNAKFELRNLSRWFRKYLSDDPIFGQQVRDSNGYYPCLSDTMIESYVLAETQFHGLKYLTNELFHHKMIEILELFPGLAKNKEKMIRFNVLQLDPKVIEYACEDAVWCLALHLRNYKQVMDRMIYKVEMEDMRGLCEAEDFGLQLDWELINGKAEEAKGFLAELNEEIMLDFTNLLGTPVNINLGSPAQVSDILFNKLGLVSTRYTASSMKKAKEGEGELKMSADKTALAKLAKDSPVVKKILVWKAVRTLLTRYLEKTDREFRYAPDDRAHPNHIQAALPAGRFAVTDPPYQQWPKKYDYTLDSGTTFKLKYRDVVMAPPGYYILGFDLSMAELRVIAGLTNEKVLLDAFAAGIDVHLATASMITGKPLSEIDDYERGRYGKTPNFSLLYGLAAASLAERFDMPVEEAEEIVFKFFNGFKALKRGIEDMKRVGRQDGYVVSKFGRLQPIWELRSDNWKIRNKGERIAVNGPVQGYVADYMKTVMARIRKALPKLGWQGKVHMIMNIHDALEFYVHESLDPIMVVETLQPYVKFPMPGMPDMKPDWHAGARWGSVEDIVCGPDGKAYWKKDRKVEATPVDEELDLTEEELEDGTLSPVDVMTLVPVRMINIELPLMPTAEQVAAFKTLINDNPGNRPVTLKTVKGSVTLKQETSLTGKDSAKIVEIFGPVRIY